MSKQKNEYKQENCCTPAGQIKRYVDCVGCDKKPKQMSKQTAVEWLIKQLTTVDYNCINKTFLQNDNSLEGHNMRKLFHQAKEMEKEQIIEAHGAKQYHKTVNGEQYYNETYKNKEK
jgi:hypothetical protein